MKTLSEKDKQKLMQEQAAKRHAEAEKHKANALAHAKKYERQHEKAGALVNKERRRFMDMIGKAGVSSSVLKASTMLGGLFASRHAMAAGGPKRVVYCYLDSGAANGHWLPRGVGNMNTVTRAYGPQGENVAGVCSFREVDVLVQGHSNTFQALGVTSYGPPTMDSRIAPIVSATTPYNAMYLGSGATSSGGLCSTIGPCIDSPSTAYNRYFNSALPAGSSDETYLKVFEAQHEAIRSIKSKLSQAERERLDTHAGALDSIEKRITLAMSSDGPDLETYRPSLPSAGSYQGRIVATGKVQADIMLAALQAGLTNVGVLQLGNHQGDWAGDGTSYRGNLHDSAHGAPGATAFNELIGHLSQVPAYFIRRLMEEEDSDGQKMIDSTVFVQVTCMGNGQNHSSGNAPFIVATRMSGFRGGYSASAGGTTMDLNGAIPKGLGIPSDAYAPMGGSTLGLV